MVVAVLTVSQESRLDRRATPCARAQRWRDPAGFVENIALEVDRGDGRQAGFVVGVPLLDTDPVGLATGAAYNYRVLQASRITDPNGNVERTDRPTARRHRTLDRRTAHPRPVFASAAGDRSRPNIRGVLRKWQLQRPAIDWFMNVSASDVAEFDGGELSDAVLSLEFVATP